MVAINMMTKTTLRALLTSCTACLVFLDGSTHHSVLLPASPAVWYSLLGSTGGRGVGEALAGRSARACTGSTIMVAVVYLTTMTTDCSEDRSLYAIDGGEKSVGAVSEEKGKRREEGREERAWVCC